MRRILVGLALLAGACNSHEVEPRPADPFPATEFCVESIIEWRSRGEGDEAYTIEAEREAEDVCASMIAERDRD